MRDAGVVGHQRPVVLSPETGLHRDASHPALFSDVFEIGKRKLRRPARLHLANGEVATIELDHVGQSSLGVRVPHPPACSVFCDIR